jgi:hypothetical protein
MTDTTTVTTVEMLSPMHLWQTPANEIVKVSNVYHADRVTAEVVYPLPPRTTVRAYTAAEVARWREPSKAMITKYERAWGFR